MIDDSLLRKSKKKKNQFYDLSINFISIVSTSFIFFIYYLSIYLFIYGLFELFIYLLFLQSLFFNAHVYR